MADSFKILEDGKCRTVVARVTFVHLFKPDNFMGTEKYGVTLLFPKNVNLNPLKKVIAEVAKTKSQVEDQFKDGDLKKDEEGYGEVFENVTYLSAKTKFKPAVFKRIKGTTVPITDPDEVYNGMYVRAVLKPRFYNYEGKKGVSVDLISVLKVKEGEKITFSSISEDYDDCEDSDLADTGTTDYDDDQSVGDHYWGKDSGKPEDNDDDVDNFDDDDDIPF